MRQTRKVWKKVKFWLTHVDGIWSLPLLFFIFWIIGSLLQYLGGRGVGTYDPGFIQPLFLAVLIVAGATNAALWLVNFNFRGVYRYIYGEKKRKKDRDGNETGELQRINYSKIDWTSLRVWQRYLIALGVFFYYVSAVILVYLHLV